MKFNKIKNNKGNNIPSINLNVRLQHLNYESIQISIKKTNIIPLWDLIQHELYSISNIEFFGEDFQSDNKVRNLNYDPVRRKYRVTQRNHNLNNSYKVGALHNKYDFDELVNLSKITFGGLKETELNELKEIKSINYGGAPISKDSFFDSDPFLNDMQNDAVIFVETYYNEAELNVQFLKSDGILEGKKNLGKIYYGNINIHKLIKRIKHALKSRVPKRPFIVEITKGETLLLEGGLVRKKSNIYHSRIRNNNAPVENINGSINVIWRLAEKKHQPTTYNDETSYMGYTWWDSEGVPKWKQNIINDEMDVIRRLYGRR